MVFKFLSKDYFLTLLKLEQPSDFDVNQCYLLVVGSEAGKQQH
jgi:hypothetical protein